MSINARAHQVKAWIKRRTDKGIHPNADDIWAYMYSKWPNGDLEAIFQELARLEKGKPR